MFSFIKSEIIAKTCNDVLFLHYRLTSTSASSILRESKTSTPRRSESAKSVRWWLIGFHNLISIHRQISCRKLLWWWWWWTWLHPVHISRGILILELMWWNRHPFLIKKLSILIVQPPRMKQQPSLAMQRTNKLYYAFTRLAEITRHLRIRKNLGEPSDQCYS